MSTIGHPLLGPPPLEVPLTNAPLVRVIAQVRFPEVLTIEQRDFVAPFQEALRATYPVLRQEQAHGLLLGPGGMATAKQQLVWRFSDAEQTWRVSLAAEFLAIETTKYSSRADFLKRFRAVLEAVDKHVAPKVIDRLGVRYIDRITGQAVDEIGHLVRPEVLGVLGSALAPQAAHALSESMFDVPNARILARWGRLPPNATTDPAAIEPAPEKSWILDLDMFRLSTTAFGVDGIITDTERFAERIYAIFRWAVTSDFLQRYGGRP